MVQRLRVRYAKRGRLRFASHRDFARALERALRRAALPVGYSGGFTPHPRISYVGAAPTTMASEAEYLEIGLTEPQDPAAVRAGLDAALPGGFDVLEVVTAAGGSLAERIDTSEWVLVLPGVAPEAVRRALAGLLERESVVVERERQDGRRHLEVRSALLWAEVGGRTSAVAEPVGSSDAPQPPDLDTYATMTMMVRHRTPAVRPDDVLTALCQVGDLFVPVPPVVTRLAQGHLDPTGRLADPFAPDRPGSGERNAGDASPAGSSVTGGVVSPP